MAKASFRWVVKMGEIMNFRALGLNYGNEVRADTDHPDAVSVSDVVGSLKAQNKCVFFWYPPEYSNIRTMFEDAHKNKSFIELFDLYLKVDGYPEEVANCRSTTVKKVFRHHNGEQAVELQMSAVNTTKR